MTTTSTMTVSTSSSDTKTLRSLYNRAVRAFLNRDLPLTHSLINSAFDVLDSFQSPTLPDFLRKWDILRITFETTVYSSPSPPNSAALPDTLKNLCLKTPQTFVSDLFERSIHSFTRARGTSKSLTKSTHNAAFDNPDSVLLPAPVLITLVYSSLKLECPESGRRMIEDWLAKRGDHLAESELNTSTYLSASASRESLNSSTESLPGPPGTEENGGYEKVVELYCIHVLPKLEQWDYATEFLEYESELGVDTRENLKSTLRNIRTQAMQSLLSTSSHSPSSLQLPSHPSSSPNSSSSNSNSPSPRTRSTSPAPSSSSSSSSSLSTTSTHTIVPATPKPLRAGPANANGDALTNGHAVTSMSSTSSLQHLSTSHTFSHSRSASSGSGSEGTITPTRNGHGLNNPLGPYASSSRSRRQGQDKSSHTSKHHHPLNPNGSTPFSLPRPLSNPRNDSKNSLTAPNGNGSAYASKVNVNAGSSRSTSLSSSSSSSTRSPRSLGFQALIRASINPYFDRLRSLGTGTRGWFILLLVLVVFPIVSMVLRRGKRNSIRAISGSGGVGIGSGSGQGVNASAIELARIKQRLRNANGSDGLGAVLGRVWGEVVRVVVDTVKMGGSGLV